MNNQENHIESLSSAYTDIEAPPPFWGVGAQSACLSKSDVKRAAKKIIVNPRFVQKISWWRVSVQCEGRSEAEVDVLKFGCLQGIC